MYFDSNLIKARLQNPGNLVIKHRNTSNKGAKFSHEEKVFIGTLARTVGAREVERQFNVSQAAASDFARGVSSVYTGENKKLREDVEAAVNDTVKQVSDKAVDILMSSLGVITPDKLQSAKITDAARIAKDMSSIAANMRPKEAPGGLNFGLQVVINAPVQKQVRDYDIIEG